MKNFAKCPFTSTKIPKTIANPKKKRSQISPKAIPLYFVKKLNTGDPSAITLEKKYNTPSTIITPQI